jgi:hypothetical protein
MTPISNAATRFNKTSIPSLPDNSTNASLQTASLQTPCQVFPWPQKRLGTDTITPHLQQDDSQPAHLDPEFEQTGSAR